MEGAVLGVVDLGGDYCMGWRRNYKVDGMNGMR